MKISTIPQIYRNVNRLTEILSVLSRYGLADGISRLNLDFAKGLLKNRDGEAIATHTREARIRMALADLGPTYIKLGQILSTRPDLVGRKLAEELQSLQDQAPADEPEVIRGIIEEELGQPIEDLFDDFQDEPLASASIGQVHRARLKTGEEVVVKVQHAGIADTIRKDLDVLTGLAQMVHRLPEFAPYRPIQMAAEFQRTLRRELDFGREERNLEQFNIRFEDNPNVAIPRPFEEYCTSQVLTMKYIQGTKLTEINTIDDPTLDREELARHGVDLFLDMIFVDGLFHADPHPGNLLVLRGNRFGLLDFGMVGRIEERLREDIEDLLISIANGDSPTLTSIILRLGNAPKDLDETTLRSELADFVSHYGSQPIERFKLSGALEEMFDMMFRYRISLPPQVAMLLKVLIALEGSSKILSPSFNLMQVIRPFQRKAIIRRLSPARRVKKLRRIYSELEHLVEVLPRRVSDILEQIQQGQFDVNLEHRGLGPSINRLVVGILSSALFLGSSLLLSQKVPPLIFQSASGEPFFLGLQDISILGLVGSVISILLSLRLIWAIGKSGHLDRRE